MIICVLDKVCSAFSVKNGLKENTGGRETNKESVAITWIAFFIFPFEAVFPHLKIEDN